MKELIESKILELDQMAKESVKAFSFKRYLYQTLCMNNSRIFKAIVGPRGVGKTILLRQVCAETQDSIYISVDILATDLDLFELVKILKQEYGIKYFFLDEIHANKYYEKYLKNIYDFLEVNLYFTSSVALSLVDTTYDLSRRVQIYELHLFPFWEFLKLNNIDVETLSLQDLLQKSSWSSFNRYAALFNDYLKGKALPYSLQGGDIVVGQRNIINTIIEKDIPSIAHMTSEDIFQLKKVVEFVGLSAVDGVNYSSLSNNLGITKYKAQQYVGLLTKAYVLNVSTPYGANVSKEPKVLLYLPNRLVFNKYEKCLGGIREDFATSIFRYLQIDYSYLKTTRGKKAPDFFFSIGGQKVVCEIGGKNKGYSQFKGLNNYDKKIVLKHTEKFREGDIPLLVLGCVDRP